MSRERQNAFATTLHFAVRPSPTQQWFVAGLHTVAAAVLIALIPYRPWLAVVLILIAGSAYRERRRALRRTGTSIVRLRWAANDVWHWQTADGRWHDGALYHALVAGAGLVVLTLGENGRRLQRTHCPLFHDALSPRAHRQLRARLTVEPPTRQAVDG